MARKNNDFFSCITKADEYNSLKGQSQSICAIFSFNKPHLLTGRQNFEADSFRENI